MGGVRGASYGVGAVPPAVVTFAPGGPKDSDVLVYIEMPRHNTNGGNASKRGKKRPTVAADEEHEHQQNRFNGAVAGEQDYARVLRMLGNRRVTCFCNDGNERICKIRQGLCRGSSNYKRIEVGDIVLISFREFSSSTNPETASDRKEIADLIDKFDRKDWRDIRKERNIHPQLFISETTGGGGAAVAPSEDIFEEEGAAEKSKETTDNPGKEDSTGESDGDDEVDVDAI